MSAQAAIQRVLNGEDLEQEVMRNAVIDLMEGHWSAIQISAFLTALRMKGETIDELTGAALAMKEKAHGVALQSFPVLDTCGTGGDGADTFNISTTVAFIAASGGVQVAKHGNRSVSSRSGSADVLEALGVNLSLNAQEVGECIESIGLGFLYAPAHHPAMRYAAPVRKELGFRTLFNLLGPLTNPANATHQLIGIFDGERVADVANVLAKLGTEKALVVHGSDGLDEITLSGETYAAMVHRGTVQSLSIHPEDVGLESAPLSTLKGGDAAQNALITKEILSGADQSPRTDVVLLNAGAAFLVAENVDNLKQGVEKARNCIQSGAALEKLNELIQFTGSKT